jgi:hypothetical protein
LPSFSLRRNLFGDEITLDFIAAIKDHVVEIPETASFKLRLEECFYSTLLKAMAGKNIKSV